MAQKQIAPSKTIALVAHDKRKEDLITWCVDHKEQLKKHKLIATGTTGKKLEEALQLPVERLLSGPMGGDQQIGSKIAEGSIDVMIFFWDAMETQAHDNDVKALLRLSVLWNIPLACDRASADFMISSPLMDESYTAEIPDKE